jgi:hypothetical protein
VNGYGFFFSCLRREHQLAPWKAPETGERLANERHHQPAAPVDAPKSGHSPLGNLEAIPQRR